MNAVGYIRISTKDQSTHSLEYQERYIRQYCVVNKLDLLAIFKDDGESSYTFDRPDYKALEKFIKQNKNVQYLVILDHDRFSRNIAEALFKIKELKDKYDINVIATSDNIDTDFTDPSTFILRAFKYMMAESELWRIRQRVKHGVVQAALNGRFTRRAPFGYVNAKDATGKPVIRIDHTKADVVRFMYRQYLGGVPIEQIRKMAKPMGYNYTSKSAVTKLLSNPIYAGFIKVPAHNKQPSKLVRGLHEPIITETDYWLSMEKVKQRSKGPGKRLSKEYPLKGVLKCFCGREMTTDRSTGRGGKVYEYYVCKVHRKAYNCDKLHSQFNDMLSILSIDEKTVKGLKDNIRHMLSEGLKNKDADTKVIKRSLKEVSLKIANTEEKYLLQPDISKATYEKVMNGLRSEESSLNKRLIELGNTNNDMLKRVEMLDRLAGSVKNAFYELDAASQFQFLKICFDQSIYYEKKIYRTAFLHPAFIHNALELKEKGLLEIDDNIVKIGRSPLSGAGETLDEIQQFLELAALFVA